jgi:hypothetical protein
VFSSSEFVSMVGSWYEVPLLRASLTSCMSKNSEPPTSSLEVIAFTSFLGFISGLLDNLPLSAEMDALLGFSLVLLH